ncbi:ferredoxin [Dactylosporangium sp. AC04546]|uniref:ferredoxin n=1 Tax=Dactylosporangium sp. AC04546 TaxID=2862460 RepID=UPI001EDD7DF8|nr:ferredoxin [Dactylosporangium sp. AC04546]WVK79841.1 ferredoxin [Dactylosporangium sp. AC04546]
MTVLHVDWTRCDGRGHCAELLPEVLVADEWGYPLRRDGAREIPDAVLRHARLAVEHCPLMALRLATT